MFRWEQAGRGRDVAIRATPTPNPSPQGGGEQTERVATIYYPAEELRLAKRALGPKHEALWWPPHPSRGRRIAAKHAQAA